MPDPFMLATKVALSGDSAVTDLYPSTNLADAFAIPLPPTASTDPELLARFIFSHQPAWVGALMSVRDTIVTCFGLKTARELATLAPVDQHGHAGRLGIFRIYSSNATEIIMGEDDKHLNFRLSVRCSALVGAAGARQLTLSTVVQCHNLLGRTYIAVIAPFHRMVVKASLRRAARIGWPQTPIDTAAAR